MFQQAVEDVHENYRDVPHNIELFDALLVKIILKPEDYQVVVVINEYDDFLSDMASGNFSFTEDDEVGIAMFDPSGGTATDIAGKSQLRS